MSSDTREQFLEAAARQFADRGFYGTSIANIAGELGLTKQALLHHFGSKEKLYGEILEQISSHALERVEAVKAEFVEPARQLEEAIVGRLHEELANTDHSRLLMRELLDNEPRAGRAGNWYLKPYLDALVAMLRATPGGAALSAPSALAVIYQLLGAVNYFVNSQPTLRHMYGQRHFDATARVFEAHLRDTVTRAID